MHDHIKHGLDATAAGAAFASWLGWLPQIAALFSIIWLSIQIGEWIYKKWRAWKCS
jgi:hypothetical protein